MLVLEFLDVMIHVNFEPVVMSHLSSHQCKSHYSSLLIIVIAEDGRYKEEKNTSTLYALPNDFIRVVN